MFGFLWKKPEKEFNLANSYLTVQFLTEDEKIKKDKIIGQLQKQYEDDLQTIVPYSESFECSYRYTLFSSSIKGKILLTEAMALIEASGDADFQQFYQTNVSKIKLHMKQNKLIQPQDILELYNERDISLYNPNDVLEIIYQRRGLLDRMKVKGKKMIKNIPQTLFNIFTKFIGAILRFMGLGSMTKVVGKFLPVKIVLSWILNFLMVFFPALAPLIGLSKLII